MAYMTAPFNGLRVPSIFQAPTPTPNRLVDLKPVLEALQKHDQTVLLVAGGRPSNFSPEMRDCERLIFWDSTHDNRSPSVPSRVSAIVGTRWMGHRLLDHLRAEARRLQIPIYLKTITPHTITELATTAGLLTAPQQKAAPVEEPITMQTAPSMPTVSTQTPTVSSQVPRGWLKSFVIKHADLNGHIPSQVFGLHEKAKALGLQTTPRSIEQSMYELRRYSGSAAYKPLKKRGRPAKKAQAPIAAKAPATTDQALKNVTDMLTEAMTAIQLAMQALQAVAPELAKAKGAMAEADDLRKRLARISDVLPKNH